MVSKQEIEQRIYAITGFTGSSDLVQLLSKCWSRESIGSDPSWMVARACMTPDEYTAFGLDGRAWRFLDGKPDLAQNCINACRLAVEQHLRPMDIHANWATARVPTDKPNLTIAGDFDRAEW